MIKPAHSFLVLYTDNLDTTELFYKQLGVTIKERDHRKCVFAFGGFDVHFNNSEDIPEYGYVFDQRSQNGALLYIEVDNIKDMFDTVKSAGGIIKSEIAERPWETKEFLFQDPNGYNVVFYEEI